MCKFDLSSGLYNRSKKINMGNSIFISGIDTECGKTIVTGLLAKYLKNNGINVITQKLVQTGCNGIAEDILQHRKIMESDILEVDKLGYTSPYVFKYPASPHLAAKMENKKIDTRRLKESTKKLENIFNIILIEGAGGLFVPLNKKTLIIDYVQKNEYPLLLVSSSELGSINHTLMSIESCLNRSIPLLGVIYNHYPGKDKIILNDTKNILREYLKKNSPKTLFYEVPIIKDEMLNIPDFHQLFLNYS
jgi:dethiobiotin synthetase